MRALIVCLICAAATPAAAQDYLGLTMARDAERVAAEQAARLRDITITNELSRLDAQVQTNRALNDLAAMRASPALPTIPQDPRAPPPVIDASKLVQIPDSILAASNARVRAAAANRK